MSLIADIRAALDEEWAAFLVDRTTGGKLTQMGAWRRDNPGEWQLLNAYRIGTSSRPNLATALGRQMVEHVDAWLLAEEQPPPPTGILPFRPRSLLAAADPLNAANYRDVVTGQPLKAITVPTAGGKLSQLAAAQHGGFDNNTSYFLKPFAVQRNGSTSARVFGLEIDCGRDVVSIRSEVRVPSVTTSGTGNANDPGGWIFDGGADDGEIHLEGPISQSVNAMTVRTHRKVRMQAFHFTARAFQDVHGPHPDLVQVWGTETSQVPCREIGMFLGTGLTTYTGLVCLVERAPGGQVDPVRWFRDRVSLHPIPRDGAFDASNMAYMCSGLTGQAGGPYCEYEGNVKVELPTGNGGQYVRGIDDIVCLRYIASPLSVFPYEIKAPSGAVLWRSPDAPTGGSGRPEAKQAGNYLTFDRVPKFVKHRFTIIPRGAPQEFPASDAGLAYEPLGYAA